MEAYVYWFVLALILLGVELATGTFYMLVMSLALGAAGVVALVGIEAEWQYVTAAVVGVVGTVLLRRSKVTARSREIQEQSLDVGQSVKVLHWRDDGTARVHYRGADWDAKPESADLAREGAFYIREVRGNTLIISHNKGE
ncbi:MAG: NfeD family protein [Sulfuricellaceae bacterium]|jgi:membrane protein implicated in regulation of membrane protease activity